MNIQSCYCCVLLEYALCLSSAERQSCLSDISQWTVQASHFGISLFVMLFCQSFWKQHIFYVYYVRKDILKFVPWNSSVIFLISFTAYVKMGLLFDIIIFPKKYSVTLIIFSTLSFRKEKYQTSIRIACHLQCICSVNVSGFSIREYNA